MPINTSDIPVELWLEIFSHLSPNNIYGHNGVTQVNKQFSAFSQNKYQIKETLAQLKPQQIVAYCKQYPDKIPDILSTKNKNKR